MKKFADWLSERDPCFFESNELKKIKRRVASTFLAGVAGIGAAAGGVGGYISGEKEGVKQNIQNVTKGSLVGAAAGALVGASALSKSKRRPGGVI